MNKNTKMASEFTAEEKLVSISNLMALMQENEQVRKDFEAFNAAIDALVALGYTEDDALEEVCQNWEFPDIND